jgi:nicotinamide mononucleotide adenylyltransferase
MRIGLLALGGKPVHAGHLKLIEIAAKETDRVEVYTSLKDRARPGEVVVRGEDMRIIWNDHIIPTLPDNVRIHFIEVPVRSVYERMGQAEEEGSDDEFKIYSDNHDLQNRFPDVKLAKYFPNLVKNDQIAGRPFERNEVAEMSGTRMRLAIQTNDFQEFSKGIPENLDVKSIWNILRRNVIMTPGKKRKERTECVIHEMIQEIIKD